MNSRRTLTYADLPEGGDSDLSSTALLAVLQSMLIEACLVSFTLDLTSHLTGGMANCDLASMLHRSKAELRDDIKASQRGQMLVVSAAHYRQPFTLQCYGVRFVREPSGEFAVGRLEEDQLFELISLHFGGLID